MFLKSKPSNVLIGFLRKKWIQNSQKPPKAPNLCKFDNSNNDFPKFLQDFLKILPEKWLNSIENGRSRIPWLM